jgi:hypothetical protein
MARRFGLLRPLADVEADSESDALATVIQSLTGGAAFLYELVSGTRVTRDTEVTPANPQGSVGVDLSGPPWGSALLHPIAWLGGAKPDTAIGYGIAPACTVQANARAVVGPWLIWVRPFERLPLPFIAPYSIGVIHIRAHDSAGGVDFCDVDVRNLSITGDPSPQLGALQFAPGTSEASITPVQGDIKIPLVPGWNVLELGFAHDDDGETVTIDSIVVNQVKKRTH